MTLLIILGALLLLTVAALLPRVHVRADVDLTHISGGVDCLWFSVSGDTCEKGFRGRFLIFRFFQKPSEKPTKTPPAEPKPSLDQPAASPPDQGVATDSPPKVPPAGKEQPSTKPKAKTSDREFDWDLMRGETDLIFAILRRFASGFRRFFRSIRADYLNLDLTLGLDDAMLTGLAFGVLHPLLFLHGGRRRISLIPRFDGYAFDFKLSCSFSMRPIQAVWVLLGEALRFPWYRSIRLAWRLSHPPRPAESGLPADAKPVASNP